MAIVKMKRLRLMVVRSEKEELLRELARRGCVEFSEIGEQVQDSQAGSALSREGSKLMPSGPSRPPSATRSPCWISMPLPRASSFPRSPRRRMTACWTEAV